MGLNSRSLVGVQKYVANQFKKLITLLMPQHNSNYRPEIDGLRAFAVLAVVLYHFGFETLSGGFVGVDIFFVISGYLITNLLVIELEENGSVNYREFYVRRIRRIIPALFFTLLIVSVAAILLFSPQRLMEYGASLLYSVLSVSNIHFFFGSGYFDSSAEVKPLLHTWSLGVEEQFYIIWPVMLAFFAATTIRYATAFIIVGVVSFVLVELFIKAAPSAVFYLMPFRMFEFAIGALLVCADTSKLKSRSLANTLFFIGLGLISFSILSFDKNTQFPGLNALLPCLGAALCIYSADKAPTLGALLTNRVCVFIGLISYSLYLVHWPLVVFFRYVTEYRELSLFDASCLLLVSLCLATWMYYFIERPFRRKSTGNFKTVRLATIFSVFLICIGASMWANSGWQWRPWAPNAYTVNEITNGKEKRFSVRQKICARKGWDHCDDPIAGEINALIMGDSHSVDALNAMYQVFPNHDFSMSQLGGCPPHESLDTLFSASHPNLAKCLKLNQNRYNQQYLKAFDYLVVNVLFNRYRVEHLDEYLTFLRSVGVQRVVVLGNYYILKEEMSEIVNRHGMEGFDEGLHAARTPVRDPVLKRMVEAKGYFYLSVKDAFCDVDQCRFFNDSGVPFTYDKNHLSYEFASQIAVDRHEELSAYLFNEAEYKPNANIENSPPLKVSDWGPKSTKAGINPNPLPDGDLGIWFKVKKGHNLSEARVYFDDQPALRTVVEEEHITARIPKTHVFSVGVKSITIREDASGDVLFAGIFEITE